MRMPIDPKYGFRIVAVVTAAGLRTGLNLATVVPAAKDKCADEAKKGDEQPKQKPKPMREEKEESKTPAIKKPIKVDDEDVDVRHPKPAKLGVTQPADLEVEARNAKHQAIKDLFHTLATPRDEVHLKIGQTLQVDPIPEFIGPSSDPDQKIHLQAYDKGKALKPQTLPLKEIVNVRSYEQNTLKQVEDLLARKAIARVDLLQAAEKALTAVVRFHASARERQKRKGEGWNEWEKRLRDRLIAVQLEQLQALADANDWENAYALATRLADSYRDKELRAKFAYQVARVIATSLRANKYEEARRRSKMLEELFPDSAA